MSDEIDVEALKSENEKLKEQTQSLSAEAASRRKALREAEEKLKNYDGVDPEEYRNLKEAVQAKEEEALKAKGDIDAIQARMRKEHEKSIKQLTEKYDQLELSYNNEVIDKALIAAFASSNAISPDDCAALVRGRCARDEQGAYIKGDDGTPLLKDGKRVTLAEFAKDWIAERPHYAKAGKAGAGSRGGSKGGDGKTITRSQFNELPHADRAKFFKEGGKVVSD
jgi:hypothetical protein